MDFQIEDTLHQHLEEEIHHRVPPMDDRHHGVSIDQMNIEACCPEDSDEFNSEQDDRLSTDAIGSSENGGSNISSDEFNEDDDDEEFDEFEDEDEEEEEIDEEAEKAKVQTLLDDVERKFPLIVSQKIQEAEKFFDKPDVLQQLLSQALQAAAATATPVNECPISVGVDLSNTSRKSEEPHCSKEMNKSEENTINNKSISQSEATESDTKTITKPEQINMSTQTDDVSLLLSQSLSKSSTSETQKKIGNTEEVNATGKDNPKPPDEKARREIGELRNVRDLLITQRQQFSSEVKNAQDKQKSDREIRKLEVKLYEIEEAIEAIDTSIEFKNEVILLRGQNKPLICDGTASGSNEIGELVAHLETLHVNEVRRLFLLFFSKVIELRSSSRKLEKDLERMESLAEQLSRRVSREHKHLREMHSQYQERILLMLSSKNEQSCFKRMDEQLAQAQKKQQDLERSLTELLVRHGYLVNGTDYDVKQVVRMLGIDESQLPGSGGETTGESPKKGGHSSHHYHSSSGQQRSTWQRGTSGGLPPSSSSSTYHSRRRNGRALDDRELSRIYRETRQLAAIEGWEQRGQERSRQQHNTQPSSHGTEVRREKGKIIIQPQQHVADGSRSGGHGQSSSHHHHSSSNTRGGNWGDGNHNGSRSRSHHGQGQGHHGGGSSYHHNNYGYK